MSAKHTPGPWRDECGCAWGIGRISRCALHDAAPVLLEALKLARSALSKASDVETFRAVSAAIAKASGES